MFVFATTWESFLASQLVWPVWNWGGLESIGLASERAAVFNAQVRLQRSMALPTCLFELLGYSPEQRVIRAGKAGSGDQAATGLVLAGICQLNHELSQK